MKRSRIGWGILALATAGSLALAGCASGGSDAGSGKPSDKRASTTLREKHDATPKPGKGTSPPVLPTLCPDGSVRREVLFGPWLGSYDYTGHIVETRGLEYDVRATITDNGCTVTGEVEYVDLECSGVWTQSSVEIVEDNPDLALALRVHFNEHIYSNPKNVCVSDATVRLLRGPAGVFYNSEWVRADGQSIADSKGHLDFVASASG